jgi:hypothetical protein
VAMMVQTICDEINIILLEKSVSVAYLVANHMLSIRWFVADYVTVLVRCA